MKAWERLINYVTVRTPSDEESETVPSSVCQFDLARKLEKEMKELGLTEVVLDDKCYLYGKLPATEGKKEIPALGFIAHMDTAPAISTSQAAGSSFSPSILIVTQAAQP